MNTTKILMTLALSSALTMTALKAASPDEVNAPASASHAPYPLSTCVVSGEQLGLMGAPVVIDYHGTEVRFCCEGCVKKFQADPSVYLAKLQAKAAN